MRNKFDYIKHLGMIIIKASPNEIDKELQMGLLVHINKDYYFVNLIRVLKFTENIMAVDSLLARYPSGFKQFYAHPIITLFYKKVFSNFPDKYVVSDEGVKKVFKKYYGFENIDYVNILRKFLTPVTNGDCVLVTREIGYMYMGSVHYCNKYFNLKLNSHSTLNYVHTNLKTVIHGLVNNFKKRRILRDNVEVFETGVDIPKAFVMINDKGSAYVIFSYHDEINNEYIPIEIYDYNANPVRVNISKTTVRRLARNYGGRGEASSLYLVNINSFKELLLYDYNTDKFKLLIVEDMVSYNGKRNEHAKTDSVRILGSGGKEFIGTFKWIVGNPLDNLVY